MYRLNFLNHGEVFTYRAFTNITELYEDYITNLYHDFNVEKERRYPRPSQSSMCIPNIDKRNLS